MKYESINVNELKKLNENNDNFTLIDVRTHPERIQAEIPIESIHIPMNEIPHRLSELDKSKNIIVQCKLGQRSAKVCHYLLDNGFYINKICKDFSGKDRCLVSTKIYK